ncbi:MAG: formate dehydrogenase accessory sulfurtransferase FdhD [Spirosomataceae bacterium]
MNVQKVPIVRIKGPNAENTTDLVVVEEPVEIRLEYWDVIKGWVEKSVSVTMRTPGEDEALAVGFLKTEGIINDEEIEAVSARFDNTVTVKLRPEVRPDLQKLQRNFYATSSCGVCGKSSLDALGYSYDNLSFAEETLRLPPELIGSLPEKLSTFQRLFDQTGGIHAAGIFDREGNLLLYAEDVGRHNAVDKIAGKALLNHFPAFDRHILVLSGRACFELLHKALAMSVPVVVAVGAPSSLAVETAERFGQTLIGFTREDRFNIYTGAQRIG